MILSKKISLPPTIKKATTGSLEDGMNSPKNQDCGSRITNGRKVRDLRFSLGLTQLELAVGIDCSERLIRKMEKNKSVSTKSLTLLCNFFKSRGVEVRLKELISQSSETLHVANQWFKERFHEYSKLADQRWFNSSLSLSDATLQKLEIIERRARASELSVGVVVDGGQNVAINFHFNHHSAPPQEPSGSLLLNITNGQIIRLNVILDQNFDDRS